jgi:hypothetical protein
MAVSCNLLIEKLEKFLGPGDGDDDGHDREKFK